jgi:hypothetical protein
MDHAADSQASLRPTETNARYLVPFGAGSDRTLGGIRLTPLMGVEIRTHPSGARRRSASVGWRSPLSADMENHWFQGIPRGDVTVSDEGGKNGGGGIGGAINSPALGVVGDCP